MGQAPDGDSYNAEGKGLPLIAGAGDFGDLHPKAKKFTTEASKVCDSGDIVLGIRATIGEKVIADGRYCLGRGVAGLRAGPQLSARYLWNWLTHINPLLVSKARGATFLQVNRGDIADLPISLPPLQEQRRIAAILDKADALRAKRLDALAQFDRLAQSIFVDMFDDPDRHIRVGATKPLSEVVAQGKLVTYGIVQAGPEIPGGVPYIKTGDIKNGRILEDRLSRTSPAIAENYARSAVSAGDIVISIRATVGTTAIVPSTLDGANLTQGTARISPGHLVRSSYLLAYLRTDAVQRWIQTQVKGATFREITLGRLRELPVHVPNLSLQESFEARVNALSELESSNASSLVKMEGLFSSLQYRAFRGDI